MAIDDYKITNAEVQAAHVQAAPNTLTGTAQENKAVFDGYPELLKEKHNGLIDELDDALSEQVDWEEDDDTTPAYIKNKPIIKKGTGTGSIIENDTNNIASGSNSHAEGNSTEASGDNSHAEGDSTEASGLYAHAEGTTTLATGTGSHTEGYLTKAAESYTHANGVGTEAHGYAETVIGQYNDYDAMNEPYAFVIGNGYEDGDRSNAHTTDWQGNAWYAGEVTDGTGNVLSEKVDKETGKGLSTNDYTTAEKMKLSGIAAGAEANVQADWEQSNSDAGDYIKNKPYIPNKTSDLTNDSNYATETYVENGLDGKVDKETGKGLSANDYTSAEKALVETIPEMAGTISNKVDKETGKGLSSNDYTTAEKTKLAGIGDGAEANVQSDWAQPDTTADDYIKNKPTLPSKTSDLTNDSDYTTKEYVDGKLPIGEASGTIACVKDGADGMPMKSLVATIVPQQSGSGTPSPENVRPISGWESVETSVCGVNVWDEEWERGSFSATTGEKVNSNDYVRTKNPLRVAPNANYYIKAVANGRLFYYDANGTFLNATEAFGDPMVITTPSTCAYMNYRWEGQTYANDISINYPSTDHDYHAYTATTHTTSLGRTVYGGTVDVVSGVLTVSKLFYTFTGAETITYGQIGGHGRFQATVLPETAKHSDQNLHRCSHYLPSSAPLSSANNVDNAISAYQTRTLWRDDSKADANEMKAWLALQYDNGTPVQLCYELATPQTYQLTPQTINTLSGVNNVWADSGDCSIEYVRDIGLALDNLLPDSPTTDGTYTLVCTVSDGKATIAWQSSGASLSSPLSMSSPASLNSQINTTEGEGDSNEIR